MEALTPAEPVTPQVDANAPAPPPAVPFHELGTEGRREFLKTGKVPDQADKTAAAATADPAEPGASTDAERKAASEPADHGKTKGKGLDKRKQQLQAEIEEMNALLRTRSEVKRQLEALETAKPDAKKDSSPAAAATPEQAYERYANDPAAPDPEDFSDLRKWGAAMSAFVAEKIAEEKFGQLFDARAQESAAAGQQQQELTQAAEVAEQRITADEAVVPDWREKMDPRFAAIPPSRLLPAGAKDSPQSFAKDQIMFDSEHPAQLAVFYSDEGNMAKLMRMVNGRPTATPQSIMRDIAYQDASFRSPSSRAGSQAAAPAAKTFTKAPNPPTTLGNRPGTAGDPVEKVINGKGKFSDFMAAMDQKEGVESAYFRRGR